MHEPEPHKMAARTAEDIGKILTRERLRLLQSIRKKTPESRSELAGMLKIGLECGKNHVKKPRRAQRTRRKNKQLTRTN